VVDSQCMGLGDARRTHRAAAAARWHALRSTILTPIQLLPLAMTPVFAWLRAEHYIANVPLWLLVGSLVFTQVAASIATFVLPPGGPRWAIAVRMGVMIAMTGFNMYLTGWGATLAVG